MIDGVPAVRAVIALYPKAPQFEGKEYVGQTFTDDQGAFKMTTFTSGDGVPAGEYVVTIEANWVSREGQDVEVPDLLKEQYSDRKKSPLKATVGEKSIVLETFDLKSKP